MKEVVGIRIKNGRLLKKLSLEKVASAIGYTKQMVSKYENGKSMPDSNTLLKLADLFEVNVDYFFTPLTLEVKEISFRKRSSMAKKDLDSVIEQIKITLENYFYVESSLSIESCFYNPVKTLKINNHDDIKKSVTKIKEAWEVGSNPVENITRLFEDKHIRVIEIDYVKNDFDGLATFVNKYPVIVINKNFPEERKRFSLLHELGHLVLNISDDLKEENVCNMFASEFLLPGETVKKEFGNSRKQISVDELIAIQKYYGVSISSIIIKLCDEGVISKERKKNYFMRLNSDPEFKKQVETSRFEYEQTPDRYRQMVFRALSQEVISMSKAAVLLDLNINEVDSAFQLV